jgi:predicted Zn-dependent protease
MNRYVKPIVQGAVFVIFLVSIWYLFQLINWTPLVQHKKIDLLSEKKIGDVLWDGIKRTEKVSNDAFVLHVLDSLVGNICRSNGIKKKEIHLHLIEKNEVNAFALPGGHLVVYSGLICKAQNSDQLCGVLAHEIAHIELKHVIRKLSAEIGVTVLFSIVTNGGNSDVVQQVLKHLSTSTFGRGLEKEADLRAIKYMDQSKINPISLAQFMKIMVEEEGELNSRFEWFSSHPATNKRVDYLTAEVKKYHQQSYVLPLSGHKWQIIQKRF